MGEVEVRKLVFAPFTLRGIVIDLDNVRGSVQRGSAQKALATAFKPELFLRVAPLSLGQAVLEGRRHHNSGHIFPRAEPVWYPATVTPGKEYGEPAAATASGHPPLRRAP